MEINVIKWIMNIRFIRGENLAINFRRKGECIVMIVKQKEVAVEELGAGVSRKMLAHQGGMMAVEVVFEKGAIGTAHTHPHEQISYILEGSFEYTIEGVIYKLEKGDTYYVPPEAVHGVVALEKSVILDVFTPQRADFLK